MIRQVLIPTVTVWVWQEEEGQHGHDAGEENAPSAAATARNGQNTASNNQTGGRCLIQSVTPPFMVKHALYGQTQRCNHAQYYRIYSMMYRAPPLAKPLSTQT